MYILCNFLRKAKNSKSLKCRYPYCTQYLHSLVMRNPNYKGRNTFFEVSPGSRTLLFQELEYKFNFRKFYSNTKIKSITFKKRDKTVLHECTLPGTGIIYKRSTVIQKRPSFLTVQNLVEKALFHFHTYP